MTLFLHLQSEGLIYVLAQKTAVVVLGFLVICGENCEPKIVQYDCTFHCCKPKNGKTVNSSWYEASCISL